MLRFQCATAVAHITLTIARHFKPRPLVPAASETVRSSSPNPWAILGVIGLGYLLATASVQSWLMSPALATGFMSRPTYEALCVLLGVIALPDTEPRNVPWMMASVIVIGAMLLTWGLGAIGRRHQLARWSWICGLCWCALGAWEPVRIVIALTGLPLLGSVIEAVPPLWVAMCLAAGMTLYRSPVAPRQESRALRESSLPTAFLSQSDRATLGLAAIYSVIFVTMNWRLWFNLFIPHGDSAMYEEHLWNVLHGKGFRSDLDQGLFLGEHIQFVHLGLIPLYVLWPSHLLMEACESVALALGVFPVVWMTQRHTQSGRVAICAAAAYLLYVPLQALDIEIDLKTFRPEAFGIPLLLLTLDQLDRGRLWGFLLGLAACLTVKEDYAIVIGPLGLWILASSWKQPQVLGRTTPRLRWAILGATLMVFSVFYLWLATRVLIPWFRPGEEIHFARYFSHLGDSPEAIVRTILFRPDIVAGELITPQTVLYALLMLLPVGGLALRSPGRLAVGMPLFGVLCLNELARDPRHHFHAPLVAIVFWAVAGGLGRIARCATGSASVFPFLNRTSTLKEKTLAEPVAHAEASERLLRAGHWLWTTAFATGLFFSLSPFGMPFWDPGSTWHWAKLYGDTDRGVEFAKIAPLIPVTARVASTDFVHPRFTHHARSYDYSQYVRKVSGYELRVPDDTDFIVIDTTHRYSTWKTPHDIPEYRDTPEQWELLTDPAGSAFIVLKRRNRN